jgi:LuxR family maltose regulon positive regulatory protein
LPGEVEALTRREVEILRCLSGSRTVAEIATELCITPSTLRTHMRNLYAKLGAHSRIEAVAIARSLDIC